MELMSAWKERIDQPPAEKAPAPRGPSLPKCPRYYAERLTVVDTLEGARDLLQLAQERPLSYVGIDTEFRYDRPGVLIKKKVVYDPRSVRPLLLSLALVEPVSQETSRIYRFVVDLRVAAVLGPLALLLQIPLCFVAHYSHVELLCLFQLGLPAPRLLWDGWVHERALHLGRGHKRYATKPATDPAEAARAEEEAKEDEAFSLSLLATCQRYGVSYPFAGDKERLQKSFLEHREATPFTQEQIEYAAADAVAAAELYPHQVQAAVQAGILQHLIGVEMPWVLTNARMVWNGAGVDAEKAMRLTAACSRHIADLEPQLAAFGITNANSSKQLKELFTREGLIDLFRHRGEVSFDKKLLAEHRHRHPAIPIIHAIRKARDLLAEQILTGDLIGVDGRVHPEHRQLGTHTGRQTCRWPNILGLGRVFRPLIVPESGFGIGEVDLCQIEVGITAAVYRDPKLGEMFNAGDVYSLMAQSFYSDRLSAPERSLPSAEFKKRHPDLRNRMKGCTLGIIYGVTAYGLSRLLGVPATETRPLLERFLGMFPSLKQALEDGARYGAFRGHVRTMTGLARHRVNAKAAVSSWEHNWMTNHPVQGSAAVVFKIAGNRLDKLYRRYNARLIVPMHDAYVFEAPIALLEEIGKLTARVMCEAVEESFPELRPKADINIAEPSRWNKESHADSIERWIEDPLYTF